MVIDDKAEAINALIEAVESIEHELGITPSGVYSDVRVRLDILEARINNPFAPAPNVENPFFIGNDGVSISTGTGYPTENRVAGSLYLRKDGYNIEGLYARRPDGYWHQIDTDPWTAAGDLAGNSYSQTVIGFQNRPFTNATPIDTLAGDGYVIGWNSTSNWWEPQLGFYAFGDLDGTKDNQTVVNLQGTPIVIGTLGSNNDGYSLIWNNSTPQWEPQRLAVVFDPLNSSVATNLRSNRYNTQSPINNTKNGIVNLGNDSVQFATGVTSNYGTLLGGDQNEVAGDYGVVVGGLQNSNTGVSGFMGGGVGNVLSGNNAVVVGGTSHNTNSANSFIGGGNSHTLSLSLFSSVLGGQTNSINSSNYSAILAGELNQIIGTSLRFASILGGSQNTINGAADGYLTIVGGYLNTVDGYYNIIGAGSNNGIINTCQYSSILNGDFNSIDGIYNTILTGNSNSITGDYNTVLNGISNFIYGFSSYSIISGQNNLLASSYSIVSGFQNSISANSNFVNIFGDNNTINTGSHYSSVWGSVNEINDGYVSVFGDHNTLNAGSTYAVVHGANNTVGNSKHTSILGTNNDIGNSDGYVTVLGSSNTISNNGRNSFVNGNNNTINVDGYNSFIHGNNNIVDSSRATVFGNDGYALFGGQFVHAAPVIDGAPTLGSFQYSRVILSGSQISGGIFNLLIPDTGTNLTLENGKSYDMSIRILINNTTGSPTCARYVVDVLAHCEANVATLDVINTTISDDNDTGWTISLSVSGNELIVTVESFVSGPNRRAIATVEWRELSRL